jgi:hypothetical protein
MKNSRRNQMNDRFFLADNQRMASIIAALKSDTDICMGGKAVNDLPFSLITPLGANNHQARH